MNSHDNSALRAPDTPPLSDKPFDEMIEIAESSSDKERALGDQLNLTAEENKAVLRKIDRNLMPVGVGYYDGR